MPAPLKYMTLDQLMASVESDLSNYADEGMINRGVVIDAIMEVNEDLGLKINKEKEVMIHVKNHKADLPDDFRYLQLALACHLGEHHTQPEVLGTHTVEHEHKDNQIAHYKYGPILANGVEIEQHECERPVFAYTGIPGPCTLEGCNGAYWVTQQFKERTIKYHNPKPIRLTNRSDRFATDDCINRRVKGNGYTIDIQNNQIITGFAEGEVYISYLTDMVDEEGNVIILDHKLLLPYYKYAAKKRILENFFINKDADIVHALQYIVGELDKSRKRALNFINTVEYTQIQDFYKANRNRFYNQYINHFDNVWGPSWSYWY